MKTSSKAIFMAGMFTLALFQTAPAFALTVTQYSSPEVSLSQPQTVPQIGEESRTKKIKIEDRTLFKVAHAGVGTKCFPNELKAVFEKIKKRYGKAPIIQSGFRSKSYNRRVGGASRSYHIRCQAADLKVPGVDKYKLAKYLKTLDGVGGVGTYACHPFVHVDIGPKRTWHWGCRRKRRV